MLELAEAVVVGGGIMGAAVTAALSRRLSRVLLIEAERIGGRATSDGFAWVNASSKWDNEAYHRLNAEACQRHLELATEWTARRTGWHAGGTLYWASRFNGGASDTLTARTEALQAWEYPVVPVSPGEMRALEPNLIFEESTFGLFVPAEGWVETARLVHFLIERAREQSAFLSEYTRVTGFTLDRAGRIATVETDRGRVSTRLVILCAGTETAKLAALAASFPPDRFPAALERSPGLLLETAQQPASARVYRVCYPPDESGLHLRPTPDRGLPIGADDTDAACTESGSLAARMDLGMADPHSWERLSHRLIERTSPFLPDLDRKDLGTARRCIRPIPIDGLPMVGPLPGVAGAYLLASHSGITLAPLLAQLLADEIITGRQSQTLAAYRPARFF